MRYAVAAIAARPRHDRFRHRSYALIMDGLRFVFKGKPWTLYVIAAKPATENFAVFLDPVLIAGDEGAGHWREALTRLPGSLIKRVLAMVSDGFQGSGNIAKQRGWIHQRCHFHLLYSLQNRLGRRRSTVRGRIIREMIYHTVCNMITDQNARKMGTYARILRRCIKNPKCPKTLVMIARDFLREFHAFRSYLDYSQLNLPATTGTIESMNKILRASCRTVNMPHALQKRAITVIRLRRKLVCNDKIYQQN
ncbi:MAG: transposase [Candidatus Sungbacteria bacterium]|nr:transposase [Candidatus Sungbacteria bacterium]